MCFRSFAISEAGSGLVGRVFWFELEAGRKHLFHEQAGGDSLQSIVDGFSHGGLCRIRFGDQIGETGAGLARCVTGGSTNDLHNLSQAGTIARSEEHTSELQSLMRISYAVFCLKKKNNTITTRNKD